MWHVLSILFYMNGITEQAIASYSPLSYWYEQFVLREGKKEGERLPSMHPMPHYLLF